MSLRGHAERSADDSPLGGDHEHDAQLRSEDDCGAQAGNGWAEGAMGGVEYASVVETVDGHEYQHLRLLAATARSLVRCGGRECGIKV